MKNSFGLKGTTIKLQFYFSVLFFLCTLSGTSAQESDIWWPVPNYPPPQKESAPAWLLSQKLNFSRWDGGPIEVCKGMLTGWTYFNPPWPSVVDATSRWYDLQTVELLEYMGFNFIWVTFSNGFSAEKERYQWELLQTYVDSCHAHGIKVTAYMSATNMFVDDMFETVPESKEWLLLDRSGQPLPYGAAAYAKIGRITRQLADMTIPAWKDYVKMRIDAAINMGFDAIEFDNTWWTIEGKRSEKLFSDFIDKNKFVDTKEARTIFEIGVKERFYREMLAYAQKRKPEVMKVAGAVNKAHQFVNGHQADFVGAKYKVDVAFITDKRLDIFSGDILYDGILTDLARENIQFDVLFEDRISKENLDSYSCVIVFNARMLSDEALTAITKYTKKGGQIIVYGQIGIADQWGQPHKSSKHPEEKSWTKASSTPEIITFVQKNTSPLFSIIDNPYVLFTITQGVESAKDEFNIHMLNYQKQPLKEVQLHCPGGDIVSLSTLTPGCGQIRKGVSKNEWVIPELGVYSILKVKHEE